MLKKRIIACLDIANGKVVKGVRFKGHEVMGDMVELAKRYSEQGIDELVFYDILASPEKRCVQPKTVESIAKVIDIPFSVAGGIKQITEARDILSAGAEKVSVNSMAIKESELVSELANEFGSQAVVVGCDSRWLGDQYGVYQYTGSEKTIQKSTYETNQWLRKVQSLGAGEIVLNTIDSDGTKNGFDIHQINQVLNGINIPVVASGGAGKQEDFSEVFKKTNVTGALAASIFHKGQVTVGQVRENLKQNGIEVRTI